LFVNKGMGKAFGIGHIVVENDSEWQDEDISAEKVFLHAQRGEFACKEIVREVYRALAILIVNLN